MTRRRPTWREQGLRPLLPIVVGLFLLALGSPSARAQDFAVRTSGDRVSVRAEAAELPDLLESLARETGMTIVWGLQPAPRPLVTVAFDGFLPCDAVPAVLEGLRFSYALGLDLSGRRVRVLYIVDATPPPPVDPALARWPARVRWGGPPGANRPPSTAPDLSTRLGRRLGAQAANASPGSTEIEEGPR